MQTTLATSGTALSLTVGNWYTLKAVIDDDPLNSALQRLRFWVDSDDDGDWSDETALITSTAIDDDWPAGYAGVHRGVQTAAAEQFDDFKAGYDTNADGDIADAGDDVQVDDNFDSAAISLSYDNNGNLTEDGVFKYVYDAWNRLVIVKRVPDAATTIATYAYDGLNRRASKVVSNQGDEVVANDGGNATVHFFYDDDGRLLETRNGSNKATGQFVRSKRHGSELICWDRNGTADTTNDCDEDTSGTGDSSGIAGDQRYFYHQDRNWNVVALSDYGSGVNGDVLERRSATRPVTICKSNSTDDLGRIVFGSSLGDPIGTLGTFRNRRSERFTGPGYYGPENLGIDWWRDAYGDTVPWDFDANPPPPPPPFDPCHQRLMEALGDRVVNDMLALLDDSGCNRPEIRCASPPAYQGPCPGGLTSPNQNAPGDWVIQLCGEIDTVAVRHELVHVLQRCHSSGVFLPIPSMPGNGPIYTACTELQAYSCSGLGESPDVTDGFCARSLLGWCDNQFNQQRCNDWGCPAWCEWSNDGAFDWALQMCVDARQAGCSQCIGIPQ